MVPDMTIAIIVSWVLVALLTGVNVFIFLKLRKASLQMMKMAAPGAKNMNEAISQMMGMMQGLGGGGRGGKRGGMPQGNQLQEAMKMLKQMQGK